jgi:hypothetical protein
MWMARRQLPRRPEAAFFRLYASPADATKSRRRASSGVSSTKTNSSFAAAGVLRF